jgi:ParB-like chromosome segregation protein Spo0J
MTSKVKDRAQPIDAVLWLGRDALTANGWNPNKVFPPELELLRLSLLEDGWTQPIVAREVKRGRYEIVDGFHRWLLSGEPAIAEITGGLVPVVLVKVDPAHARISTIRHNRARGEHYVGQMANIVTELADMGLSDEELEERLGMEAEEVIRLKQRGDVLTRIGGEQMGEAWRSAPKS